MITKKYTGFVIKTFDITGQSVSAVVHYNVTAKQEGYETFGDVVVISQPAGGPSMVEPSESSAEPVIESVDVSAVPTEQASVEEPVTATEPLSNQSVTPESAILENPIPASEF